MMVFVKLNIYFCAENRLFIFESIQYQPVLAEMLIHFQMTVFSIAVTVLFVDGSSQCF